MAKAETVDQVHPTNSAHHHAGKFTSRQRTIALTIVALAFVIDLLDNTIVNIAIPSIQIDLGASYSAIQWLTAGYALAFAVLLITGGRLGDVVGYKKLFMTGVAGFTIASLLSGVAWSTEILVGARLFQGAMAALMVPQVMSLMQVMYKPKERGAVMGLFGALGGLAASLGPVVGGLLIQANIAGLDWRPIFLINIPIGLFAFFAAIKYLPSGKSPHPLKLDIFGTGLIIVALGLLLFPLIEGRELDWPAWVFIMMAVSLPIFAVFWIWQLKKNKKDSSPLIIPSLFKANSFRIGLIVNIVFQMIMLGFFFTFTLVLQIGLGYKVLEAALTGLPTAVGISFSIGFLAQKLTKKLGRYTMSIGAVIMALGLGAIVLALAISGHDTQPWEFIPGLLLTGTGMGLVMGLMFSVTLKDVDTKHAGSASGTLNAVSQLGGAIGIAIVGVIFFGHLTSNAQTSFAVVEPQIRSELTSQMVPVQAQDTILKNIQTCYVDRTSQKDTTQTPASCQALETTSAAQTPGSQKLSDIITSATKQAASDNFTNAFSVTMIYAISLVGITFLLSFLLPRKIDFEMAH
ncbi:MAG: drug resistance transporter, EmrB/QacA subfamily [Candidatus Saccharibacteria bacterium]|nr:drug resistance transporter, EmrB/QacA subfamily [Candidatus Saccharibacteria bacterium]